MGKREGERRRRRERRERKEVLEREDEGDCLTLSNIRGAVLGGVHSTLCLTNSASKNFTNSISKQKSQLKGAPYPAHAWLLGRTKF